MKSFLVCLFLSLFMLSFVAEQASAARFGGGRSIGVQRSHSTMQRTHQPAKPPGQQPTKKPMGGMLGGFLGGALLGGLLTSLFMGHGLGTGLLSWVILIAVAYLIYSFFRRKGAQQAAFQSGPQQANPFQQQQHFTPSSPFNTSPANESSEYPTGFAADEFLRTAKVTFTRLQAAYDQKNLQDIYSFTAPDVYAEIKMQLDERGNAANKTEIVDLNADLLDASKQVNEIIASVRFTGFIKENDEPMTSLDEIWHFRQSSPNENWIVVGIQQEDVQPQ